MSWPWVSRRAYDLLLHNVERLETQNDKLIEAATRQRRFEAGMTETPRPERKPLEPMPHELRQHIKGWGGSGTQRMQHSQAYRRHHQGESWVEIMADMMREDEGLNLAEDELEDEAQDEEALPATGDDNDQ
ncbi:hypothetical protein LCGC14_2666110 [marine sediment metagenome]|uniref:Uncharacterized protein n=1 Tax=marine sediment metagenome TaxID=412755 RepID=A0A0F9CHD9_9ZZZZ